MTSRDLCATRWSSTWHSMSCRSCQNSLCCAALCVAVLCCIVCSCAVLHCVQLCFVLHHSHQQTKWQLDRGSAFDTHKPCGSQNMLHCTGATLAALTAYRLLKSDCTWLELALALVHPWASALYTRMVHNGQNGWLLFNVRSGLVMCPYAKGLCVYGCDVARHFQSVGCNQQPPS